MPIGNRNGDVLFGHRTAVFVEFLFYKTFPLWFDKFEFIIKVKNKSDIVMLLKDRQSGIENHTVSLEVPIDRVEDLNGIKKWIIKVIRTYEHEEPREVCIFHFHIDSIKNKVKKFKIKNKLGELRVLK